MKKNKKILKKFGSLRAMCLLPVVSLFAGAALNAADEEVPTLTIFNFSEYIDPDVYTQFEEAYHCKIVEVSYETAEEAMNKMIAGGSRTFDVCSVGGNFMMPAAVQQGILLELDHSKLPNLQYLSSIFKNPSYDPGNKFSVPYQWGTTGVVIRSELLPDEGFSIAAFFDPEKQLGRFVLLDTVREMLGYANMLQGKDINAVDVKTLKKSIDMMITAKKSKNFMGFEGGMGGRAKVLAGAADYAIVYGGDALRMMEENPGEFSYVVPNEGVPAWVDQLCIAKDAPHKELAYAFINYILDPKIAAQISTWTKFPSPVEAAKEFIPEEDLNNPAIYPTSKEMGKLQFVTNLGAQEALRTEAWTVIKAN